MWQRRSKSQSSARWIISNDGTLNQPPGIFRGLFLAFYRPPAVAGIFMPFLRCGSSGVLSGLFFGGILFHPGILSACVGLLMPPWYRRRIIPLLQGRYKHCTGRFPGVASLHHVRDFAPPWAAWRGRDGIGPGGHGFCPGVGPADLGRNLQEGMAWGSGHGRGEQRAG